MALESIRTLFSRVTNPNGHLPELRTGVELSSSRIGSLLGISVRLHYTLILAVTLIAWSLSSGVLGWSEVTRVDMCLTMPLDAP